MDYVFIGNIGPGVNSNNRLTVQTDGFTAGHFYSDRISSSTNIMHIESAYDTVAKSDIKGVYVDLNTAHFFGIGAQITAGYKGLDIKDVPVIPDSNANATYFGVYANSFIPGTPRGSQYGIYGYASGAKSDTTNSGNYSIYGEGGSTGLKNYAGYFSGDVTVTGTFSNPSDAKLKTNIKPLATGMQKIMQLKPSSYAYRTNEYDFMKLPKGERFGFIAQDYKKVMPNSVSYQVHPETEAKALEGSDGDLKPHDAVSYMAIDFSNLAPVMVKGMQEQQTKIESLEQEVEELKAALQQLLIK